MSFVFCDTETAGTHAAFDQILQFGAVRAEHELRDLECFGIRCRLLPTKARCLVSHCPKQSGKRAKFWPIRPATRRPC